MAREGVTVIVISSSSSSSSSSSEDEEAAYERSHKLKLRREYPRLFKRPPGRESGGGDEEDDDDDDDCVILEKDPFGEVAQTIADLPSKLSLSSRGGEGGNGGTFRQQTQQHQEGEGEEESEVFIVAERGKVALRDYPHSRHLCAKHPFSRTPHENYCNQCYCYVCDKPAPCGQWKEMPRGHCNATDQDDLWNKLRKAYRSNPSSQKVGS